ncbi:MAG: type II toxin-antitoxin system Phd/YefM family antitoxin [Lachnospiraceae bacterium]|nr:type II toxin-antitoxin system Phd/YefM family antitoxin [Lachnospiraceae bacterium]
MAELNENLISITKANQNFSEVARKCKELGKVYILKNNKIAFCLECIDSEQNEKFELTDEEMFQIASKRVLKKYHKAFEELAK